MPIREPNYTSSADFGGSLQGMGLGLKLAMLEAELWGGQLSITPAPGQPHGTKIRMSFPAADNQE